MSDLKPATTAGPYSLGSAPTSHRVMRNIEKDDFALNDVLAYGANIRNKVPYQPYHTHAGDGKGNYCSAEEYRAATKDMTHLQKHVAWFDGDADGVIWPTDTYAAFYKLGFGLILSFVATMIIHGPFSYPTIPRRGNALWHWLPDPFMRIWVANIHRNKHGSDSETYSRRGEYRREKLQEMVRDYSSAPNRDALSAADIMTILYGRRNILDFFGVFAMFFEFGSSYMLLWPADGYCTLEDIEGVYDGSIFPVIARDRREKGAFRRKGKVL